MIGIGTWTGDGAADAGPHHGRLRRFVIFDAVTAGTAVVALVGTWAFVLRSPWLLVLAAMVGVSGLVMLTGLVPLGKGDSAGTVRVLAVANWAIALGSTAIATFAWPMMVLAALLPALFAPPYTPRRRLPRYVGISLVVSMTVAALGLLQDFSGLTGSLPEWVPATVTIFFTPFLGGMIAQLGLSNSARLQALLNEARHTNERLTASEAALRENAEQLRASRARVVAATDRERRRMERDLHDGTQQRLVALGLQLSMARELCRRDPEAAARTLGRLREDVRETQTELRRLAQGMYPPVLTEHGLGAALQSAADRLPTDVTLSLDGIGRHPPEVEATVYFCCVEALQNVAKHAGVGARAAVSLGTDGDGYLVFRVSDNGCGFDPDGGRVGTGLENLADRLGAVGGVLTVHSDPSRGTTVTGRILSEPT
jgi:signal transduction histidine kinase